MTRAIKKNDGSCADTSIRQRWLRTLALSDVQDMDRLTATLFCPDEFEWIRQPQTGLYRLQGRLDGAGDRFNLADMTVTRCALRSQSGAAGDTPDLDLCKFQQGSDLEPHLGASLFIKVAGLSEGVEPDRR